MSVLRFEPVILGLLNRKVVENGKKCRDPGSNRGPLDLQSNALPTELSRRIESDLRISTN